MYEKEKCAHSWTFLASYFFFYFIFEGQKNLVWHLKGDVLSLGKSNPLDRKNIFDIFFGLIITFKFSYFAGKEIKFSIFFASRLVADVLTFKKAKNFSKIRPKITLQHIISIQTKIAGLKSYLYIFTHILLGNVKFGNKSMQIFYCETEIHRPRTY
jgi:hypothetical protein